ncbi:Membrane-associated phosphatidylinositol transfer protein 3 [Trichinella murrelli]|uniref:Membrane-associated phosphatidylinositol transfer protein 3 n=1 Tax=Trichinella murrelli TaxID=144512 RepID=A0A0V0U866_9BILA|nr:Membrane-associated phosphatidylinositol transfer protein 3 [Trichinella murrelli]
MLIKEYRILLPMTVEEYRIAQLYMIQTVLNNLLRHKMVYHPGNVKHACCFLVSVIFEMLQTGILYLCFPSCLHFCWKKSREETKGAGSGVEIIVNEPYNDDESGERGQYTFKIYHIGSHLPAWFRSILPESALRVVEEAWNAYPHTKTKFSCPFVEKFSLEVETKYFDDAGIQENVFNLTSSQLNDRIVDLMDIVNDSYPVQDYCKDEDPKLYKSTVTGRGPLKESWIKDCQENGRPIMCAYKLCKVHFCYWGMQSKIEKFIHDYALRRVMLRAHRQAWAWQDEWCGLTIDDVRRLENEAQLALQAKMANVAKIDDSLSAETRHYLEKIKNKNSATEVVAMSNAANPETDILSVFEDDEEEFYDAVEECSSETTQYQCQLQSDNSEYSCRKVSNTLSTSDNKVKHLLLLFHGGSILDSGHDNVLSHSKQLDLNTFRMTLESVIKAQYEIMHGAIAVRLVPCTNSFGESLKLLQSICPYGIGYGQNLDMSRQFWNFIPSLIPILSVSSSKYAECVVTIVQKANQVYSDFLQSDEGVGFDGKVSICGDAIGGLLAFDALCDLTMSRAVNLNDPLYRRVDQQRKFTPTPSSVVSCSTSLVGESSLGTKADNDNSGRLSKMVVVDGDNSANSEFAFPVQHLFLFGTSLGYVLVMRKIANNPKLDLISSLAGRQLSLDDERYVMCHMNSHLVCTDSFAFPAPRCEQVYNLYYATDPCSVRIEPLLLTEFSVIPPVNIPRYERFPLGDGQSMHILDCVPLFATEKHSLTPNLEKNPLFHRRRSVASLSSEYGRSENNLKSADRISTLLSKWWGCKRLDYALFSPVDLIKLPLASLSDIFHASFWESKDVCAFILRQFICGDVFWNENRQAGSLVEAKSADKWLKWHTTLKVKNIAANHRANDVAVNENQDQILQARFMYGPFDMVALSGELVDVNIMRDVQTGEWTLYGSTLTDSHGRLRFELTNGQRLPVGLYPVRMVVRGDNSSLDMSLAVLPRDTECVVFSIDGSFTASVSLTGKNPRVRPSAVDVVRHWQDLGYLIVYISARPDLQQRIVTAWLVEHNFPFGLLFFNEGFSTDLLKQKTNTLKSLITDCGLRIHVAYGSAKDIRGYAELGLPASRIFALGRVSKKLHHECLVLADGYSSHLCELCGGQLSYLATPAQGDGRLILQHSRCSFSLADRVSVVRSSNLSAVARSRSFTPRTATKRCSITSTPMTDRGPVRRR